MNTKESNDMSLVDGYEKVMICSAGWLSPLLSPTAALVAKIVGLMWAYQMQG
jgi:sorbitol-specific phosphotransferase system component IIBC